MKRLIPLILLCALAAACEGNTTQLDRNWYLDAGGEQALFRQMTLTRDDQGAAEGQPSRTIITLTSEKLLTKEVVSVNTDGSTSQVFCEGSTLIAGADYQQFSSLLAQAKIVDFQGSPEINAQCVSDEAFTYGIAYARADGKTANITSTAGTCPFSEAIIAVIGALEALSNANPPPACISPVGKKAVLGELTVDFGAAIVPKSVGEKVSVTDEFTITVTEYYADGDKPIDIFCTKTGMVNGDEFQSLDDLAAAANLVSYQPAADCTPLVGTTGKTIEYQQNDGQSASFHTACELPAEINALLKALEDIAEPLSIQCLPAL